MLKINAQKFRDYSELDKPITLNMNFVNMGEIKEINNFQNVREKNGKEKRYGITKIME